MRANAPNATAHRHGLQADRRARTGAAARRRRVLPLLVLLLASGAVHAGQLNPAAIKRYTFEQALDRALRRNPSIETARQEILRAEALVRQARAPALPTLVGQAVGSRIDHERKIGDRTVQGAQSLAANLTLAVPLFAPQRWLQWVHARDNVELSQVSASDLRRSLALSVARAYLAVVAQQRNVEVADRGFATAQAHYAFAHERRRGGVGNRLDEVRAEQEQEATRAQTQLARSALLRAQEALGVLLAEDGPVEAVAAVRLPAPPPLGAALHEAPTRRSDVALLERRAAAAARVRRDSYADLLPTLTGQLVPFYQQPATITQPTTGWQAQLILSVPFFDGGLRYGARRERAALEGEARLALQAASRQVQAEVRSAFEALQRTDQALGAAHRAAALAGEALALATTAYQAGATTNLEVIDAERRARDAETAAAVAEDLARQARLDLLAASGRFPPRRP